MPLTRAALRKLAMLDAAVYRLAGSSKDREHITHALFPTPPPPCPDGVYCVDTQEQYEAIRAIMESGDAWTQTEKPRS